MRQSLWATGSSLCSSTIKTTYRPQMQIPGVNAPVPSEIPSATAATVTSSTNVTTPTTATATASSSGATVQTTSSPTDNQATTATATATTATSTSTPTPRLKARLITIALKMATAAPLTARTQTTRMSSHDNWSIFCYFHSKSCTRNYATLAVSQY